MGRLLFSYSKAYSPECLEKGHSQKSPCGILYRIDLSEARRLLSDSPVPIPKPRQDV